MTPPDLNLLIALDALLSEGSVARAATRLRLSPSAMSRTLSRLREATGDPLMVRAGRVLVPTPRATELRDRTAQLVRDAESVLRPAAATKVAEIARTFTLRSSDGFVENFGPALISRIAKEAPGVRLRFIQKTDKESAPLREAAVDLETGVVDEGTAPELRMRSLFRDRFVGVVRRKHPLCEGRMTLARYAGAGHVSVSRRGMTSGPVDGALAALGVERHIVTSVTAFSAALAIARAADLVATVPEAHTRNLRTGLASFRLPFETPELTVAMLWHPRLDADPAHRWLRDVVGSVCRAGSG